MNAIILWLPCIVLSNVKVGYSPLLTACEYQKVETVRYLASREDIDVLYSAEEVGPGERVGHKSGLHLAAIHDSSDIADILLKHGCTVDIVDEKVRLPTVAHLDGSLMSLSTLCMLMEVLYCMLVIIYTGWHCIACCLSEVEWICSGSSRVIRCRAWNGHYWHQKSCKELYLECFRVF